MKIKYKAFDSTRLQMPSIVEKKHTTGYDVFDPAYATTTQEKSRTKSELLEQLAVVEIGLKKNLKLRQSKGTTKKLHLLEELKRRVEASPENIRISFDLYSPPIRTSCHVCMAQPNIEVHLEHQLTEAIRSLGAEENDYNEVDTTSSGSSLDTASYGSGQATKSLTSHDDDEVILVRKSDIQPDENGLIDICISGTQRISTPGPDFPAGVSHSISIEKSSTRVGGILLRQTDYGNDIGDDGCCKTERRSRSTRTVSFCNKNSEVRFIDAKPSLQDRLAKARDLISNAQTSRETLVSVNT